MSNKPSYGKLYLIPSPLSETGLDNVIPPAVSTIVNKLRYFVVEDLRTARRYISKLKPETPVNELNFGLLNEHTSHEEIAELIKPLCEGYDMGLISDAGMPCIADPGEELVTAAHSKGIKVVPVTGPSSVFLALAASGLSGESFSFEGYLPAKTPDLIKELKRLEQHSLQNGQSKIFIETPYRSLRMLQTVTEVCSGQTKVCVACNITADNEYIVTKTVAQWKQAMPDINKMPCIFIIQA